LDKAALVKLHCYVCGEKFNPIEPTTHGLPKSWKSHLPAKPMSPCNSTLGILAGSRFITHQFFLTNRSLFLLAWHARMGFDVGKLYYWLDTLTALVPDSPVLLVATLPLMG